MAAATSADAYGGMTGRRVGSGLGVRGAETPSAEERRRAEAIAKRALFRTRTGDPFLTMEVLYQLS
jgi:hypothetical protein